MNLEFYRNFIAMVEAGGMNRASREIHVAQPALTRQLQVMEKEYGAALVKPRKGRHALELTEAGWILYRQARQICEADGMARSEIAALSEGLSGTLHLSISPSLMPMVIEKGIRPFHEKYSDMTFRLRESYQLPLAEEVRRGISEMGITNAPLPDPSLFRVLHEETCTLMAAARRDSHFLPDRESLRPEDLASAPLAVSRSTEEAVKQFFGEKGLRAPHPLCRRRPLLCPGHGRGRPCGCRHHPGSLGKGGRGYGPHPSGQPLFPPVHHFLLPEGPSPLQGHGTVPCLSGKRTGHAGGVKVSFILLPPPTGMDGQMCHLRHVPKSFADAQDSVCGRREV